MSQVECLISEFCKPFFVQWLYFATQMPMLLSVTQRVLQTGYTFIQTFIMSPIENPRQKQVFEYPRISPFYLLLYCLFFNYGWLFPNKLNFRKNNIYLHHKISYLVFWYILVRSQLNSFLYARTIQCNKVWFTYCSGITSPLFYCFTRKLTRSWSYSVFKNNPCKGNSNIHRIWSKSN